MNCNESRKKESGRITQVAAVVQQKANAGDNWLTDSMHIAFKCPEAKQSHRAKDWFPVATIQNNTE